MKMQVADYAEWLTRRYWTDIEASFLLCGLRPYYGSLDERHDSEFTRLYSPHEREKIKKIHNLILDAIKNGYGLLPQGCDMGCRCNQYSVLRSQTFSSRQIAKNCLLGYGTKPDSTLRNVLIPYETNSYQNGKTVHFLTHYQVWSWATIDNKHISRFDSGKFGVGNLTSLAIAKGIKLSDKKDLKKSDQQKREDVLKEVLSEIEAKYPDYNRFQLPFSRNEIFKKLSQKDKDLFDIAHDTFIKFFKKQKLCALKSGAPTKNK
jgi:hypothetical protein